MPQLGPTLQLMTLISLSLTRRRSLNKPRQQRLQCKQLHLRRKMTREAAAPAETTTTMMVNKQQYPLLIRHHVPQLLHSLQYSLPRHPLPSLLPSLPLNMPLTEASISPSSMIRLVRPLVRTLTMTRSKEMEK